MHLFIEKNVRHFFIYGYIFKIAVFTLASVILNLKIFEFFVLDGQSSKFYQQRRHTYFWRSHVHLLVLYKKKGTFF